MSQITNISGVTASVAKSQYAAVNSQPGNGVFYDEVIYDPSGYDAHIWALQRPLLEALTRDLGSARSRYLDFACGTGRILAALESLVGTSYGVDISPDMLRHAADRCHRSQLICGDLLAEPGVFEEAFDVITAFRFFLNTEPSLRQPVMQTLAELLSGPDARLIFNVHGHRPSSLLLQSAYHRLRKWPALHTMSLADINALVDSADLEVVGWYGFGLFPYRLYRTPLSRVAKFLDRLAARRQWLRTVSHDVVVVCRKQSTAGVA